MYEYNIHLNALFFKFMGLKIFLQPIYEHLSTVNVSFWNTCINIINNYFNSTIIQYYLMYVN